MTVTIDSCSVEPPASRTGCPQNDAPVPGWARAVGMTAPGDYTVHVGTSSAETPLVETIPLSLDRREAPGTPPATCPTIRPGPDWVCVNGGWFPPGSPTGGSVPPPGAVRRFSRDLTGSASMVAGSHPGLRRLAGRSHHPAASCPTIQPGPDWVCVNGGWLPPGLRQPSRQSRHPRQRRLSDGTAGADWVCVNGGWVPADHPRRWLGPTPPSMIPELVLVDRAHLVRVRDSLA